MSDLTCGKHKAYAYTRGGAARIGELTPLTLCRWHRERDAISGAEVVVGTDECCGMLDDLRTILNELHIYRNGVKVWEGPIVRLEYEHDHVRIFASDVLWQATRTVVSPGFNHSGKNTGLVLDTMSSLLDQCYSRQGDPWNMLPAHILPIRSEGEPKHNRVCNNWQAYVWEEFDKFAEDYGADYTVVNRDIYFWDVHLAWKILPPLDEDWISEFPRIVEYGNSLFTRSVKTNGRGYAGVDEAGLPVTHRSQYGYVDKLDSEINETDTEKRPDDAQLARWQEAAAKALRGTWPAPVGVVVPDNTTLLPSSTWKIPDLIPGAWFQVNVQRLCRKVTTWNRLQRLAVEEIAPGGETIQFSSITAPREMVIP